MWMESFFTPNSENGILLHSMWVIFYTFLGRLYFLRQDLQDFLDFIFSRFPPARQCQATCPPLPCLLTFQLSGDRGAGRRVAGGDETEKPQSAHGGRSELPQLNSCRI